MANQKTLSKKADYMTIKTHFNNPKVQLQTIILQSSLQESQKKLWHNFIDKIPDDATAILDVLDDDVGSLEFLTKNLEEKMNAIKIGDKAAWEMIIKEEKQFLAQK